MKSLHQCISRQNLNFSISFSSCFLPSKCFQIIPMGQQTSLNLKVIIAIVSFKQNINLKIQMLAGKEAKSFFERFFKNITSLVAGSSNAMQESLYFIAAALLVICSTTTKNRTRYRQGERTREVSTRGDPNYLGLSFKSHL